VLGASRLYGYPDPNDARSVLARYWARKVNAIRDFSVEPFFDEGWDVKKGMIGFIHSLGQEGGEIAVDFNEALGGGIEKGDIVLLVSFDAIEPV
jgi:hypothetical protein